MTEQRNVRMVCGGYKYDDRVNEMKQQQRNNASRIVNKMQLDDTGEYSIMRISKLVQCWLLLILYIT